MDNFKTITAPVETKIVIKKSTFYSFALPIETEEEAEKTLKEFRKRFYDARHICYGYILGADSSISKSSDNGEPSGTAGRPIMGAIMSAGITNILIIVVRYFGGILLGTPGLIAAYKEGATSVIAAAEIIVKTQEMTATIEFDYQVMNNVMKLIKQIGIKVVSNQTDMRCRLQIQSPKSVMESTLPQFEKIESLRIL